MGKYVEQNLGKNEVLVKKAELNALALLSAWIFGILFCWLLLIPTIKAIIKTVQFNHIELAVTNKRVVGKVGVLNTKALDAPLNKIQSANVTQKLGGKIFNYSTVHIHTAAGEYHFENIKNGDALQYDFAKESREDVHIVSNLPYNISVPLLVKWLEKIKDYKSLTLMFQKEVADRILAPIRCKDYGRISILAQLQCRITRLFDLSPECFVPAPKVWSSVLLFQPQEKTLSQEQINKLEKLTVQAFSQRRKMIRQSLKSLHGLEAACEAEDIALTSRPEELSPQQFLSLSERINS